MKLSDVKEIFKTQRFSITIKNAIEGAGRALIIVYHSGRSGNGLEEGRISMVWFSLAGQSTYSF